MSDLRTLIQRYGTWLFLLVLVITFVPWLGETLFNTKGEPREAIVAYSMIDSGNWILPVSFGCDIPYKPPFLAWCIAIASYLTGGVNEFSSRLPSAVATICMAMATLMFFRRNTGSSAIGFLTAAVTVTALEVFRAASACRVDMVLTACMTGALYCLYTHREEGRRGLAWGAIGLMTCAVLTKGPIGMLLPCLVAGIYGLLRGAKFRPLLLRLTASGLLACVIPALWYVAAYRQGGEAFLDLVMEENFGRFLGKMSYDSHVQPVYYNFITVIAGMVPYTLLAVAALFTVHWRRVRLSLARVREAIRTADAATLFAAVSAIVIFVFYCIPKSKRSVYLLPMYPFLAYFVALLLIRLARSNSGALRLYAGVIGSIAVLLPVGLTGFSIASHFTGTGHSPVTEALAGMPGSITGGVIFLVSAIFGLATLRGIKGPGKMTAVRTVVSTFGIYWCLSAAVLPPVLNAKSDITLARKLEELAPEGKIYQFLDIEMLRYYTANFYLGDRMRMFDQELPHEGYVVVSEKDMESFTNRYGDHYDMELLYTSPQKSCDRRDIASIYHFTER